MDRSRLYERINARVDTMMEQGLLQEIEQLHTLQEDVWSLQSFQGIGYKEWKAYIEDRESVDTCVERIKKIHVILRNASIHGSAIRCRCTGMMLKMRTIAKRF